MREKFVSCPSSSVLLLENRRRETRRTPWQRRCQRHRRGREYHRRVVVRSETARKRWRAWWIDDAHGRDYNPAQKQNIAAATCGSRKDLASAFFFSPSSSPAANDERDEEKDERGRLSSLTVTVENPTRGADEGNARKNQCTKVVVEGPNRRGELASMASSLTSYGVDIIFAQAEAIGCAVDAYYDASLSSSSSKKKNKKNKKSALNSSTTSPSSSSNAKDADEDDDEEEEISCAKIIFWVQLNGKMLDVTQQEDLRAFLQASLLPENNSIIDGETSSTQTTEDLFKEYTRS